MRHLLRFISSPHFQDPETSRQAELLNSISILLVLILSGFLFINLALHNILGAAINPIFATLIVSQIVGQFMIRRGFVRQAGLLLLLVSWMSITWLASFADGVRDVVLFAYVTILLGAGYMYGWRAVLGFGVFSILAVWVLAFSEINGLLTPALTHPVRIAMYLTALLVLVSFQIYYVVNTLKRALTESTFELHARQQAETLLRNEQDKLNLALDAAKMGTWSWDVVTGTVQWSESLVSLFGMDKDSFNGNYSSFLSVINPDELAVFREQIRQAMKENEFFQNVELRIRMSDGSTHWLEGRGRVHRDEAGKPLRMAGTLMDITERKRSEDALRLAEEKYRTIVENAAHGIFQSTPAGKYLSVNSALAKIYGYASPEEYIQSIDAIQSQVYVDPADRDRFAQFLREQDAIYAFEVRNRRKDGSIIWITCNARAVRDDGGNIQYYEGTVEDITERKEASAERERLLGELSAKNAELERFVYTVSHDLKSPLVTIVGFLGYVEEDFKNNDAEALHKDMDRIYRATFKMQELLQDLLDLSRVGRMMNEPQVISFDALVDEAVELTQGRLHERGIQVNIQPNLPNVHGDAKRLLELVQNLIDNAAKYMGDQPDPRIEIGCSGAESDKPVFFVRDNGMGIALEHHDRIFGLFNKLDPNIEGTGVGLALVKRIVEFHGGRIWVESEVGQGATFYFSLPAGENINS